MSSQSRLSRRVSLRSRAAPEVRAPAAAQPALRSIDDTPSFKNKAYTALKNAIVAMDIYRSRDDIRLDERKLAHDFGISRTPVREALSLIHICLLVVGYARHGAMGLCALCRADLPDLG